MMGSSSCKMAFGWNHEPQGEFDLVVLSVKPVVLEHHLQSIAELRSKKNCGLIKLKALGTLSRARSSLRITPV